MIQIKLREIILALFAAVGTAYEPTSRVKKRDQGSWSARNSGSPAPVYSSFSLGILHSLQQRYEGNGLQ